jgi:hypothetical protein
LSKQEKMVAGAFHAKERAGKRAASQIISETRR